MKPILLQLFLLCTTLLPAQEIEWQKSLGGTATDRARAIQQTADGGYVVAGESNSNNGDVSGNHGLWDFWVVKLDSLGNIQWQNCYGGSANDYPNSIQQTTDGGYVVAGYTLSNNTGQVSGNHGDKDFWVIKLDSLGNLLWQNCLGGTGPDEAHSVQQTTDGGYIVAGTTKSTDGDVSGYYGEIDYWMVKLSPAGVLQWQNSYGGSDDDYAYSVRQTLDGGYIIGGYTTSTDGNVTGNHGGFGNNDIWIVKTNAAGFIQWQKCLGGTNSDHAWSVHEAQDGGYFVAGRSYSNDGDVTGHHGSTGSSDMWIVKLDGSGNIQWQKSLGGSNGGEQAYAVYPTFDGGCVAAGQTIYSFDGDVSGNHGKWDFWVVKLDVAGNIHWTRCLGGTEVDMAYDVKQTDDQSFIVAGYSTSNNTDVTGNRGGEDFWVVKLTNQVNLITGNIFLDSNTNNVQDAGEADLSYQKVIETNTGSIGFSNSEGDYYIFVTDSGNFSVQAEPVTHYTMTPNNHNIYFNTGQLTDSLNNFAFQSVGPVNDLCVTITPAGPFRAGFNAGYVINYKNAGTTSINNCTIVFFPHQDVNYVSSSESPVSITPDSVVWNIGLLSPFQTGIIVVTVNVNIGTPIGTVINSGAAIYPVAGDVNPVCNINFFEAFITGSYDPNDILVSRGTLFTTEFPNPPYLDTSFAFKIPEMILRSP